MKKFVGALVAIVALSAVLSAAPSNAAADGTAAITELAVYRDPAATEVDQVIYLEAGSQSWKIKQVAAALDAQVDGLTIVSGAPGTCDRAPTALCVTVVVGSWDEAQQREMALGDFVWRGLTTVDSDSHRTIHLNSNPMGAPCTQPRCKKAIAAHELGHAVGLDHDNWGLMSVTGKATAWFSDTELALLRSWYSVPRYR